MPPASGLKSICIVAHFAYGAITGERSGHFGGVERQVSLLAPWLASRGYRVSLLTWDEGNPGDENIGGVRVVKMCRRDAGMHGLRFFHPRWTSLCEAMSRADADLYYQNCAEYVTGQVALWCRRKRRHFVYAVASDPDCHPALPKLRTLREKVLYRYGLRHADRVVVQTRTQKEMLREGFGIDARILPMACPTPPEGPSSERERGGSGRFRVLWVGRLSRIKRPEMFIEIARTMPEIEFDVVGAPDREDEYASRLYRSAAGIRNLTLSGRVRRDGMAAIYRGASLLCCTSESEGFPNAFLEAWSLGLPVVSTFDPDGLIATRRLGEVVRDAESARSAIRRLAGDEELRRTVGENARRYFLDNHTIETVMPQYETTFVDVGRNRRSA